MAFQWTDYLTLAKRLSQETTEAAQRAAISRAYYSIYHLAQARAVPNGLDVKGRGSKHKLTWDFFSSSSDLECKKLGQLGVRLRDRRNKADYDNPYDGKITDEASDTVEKAAEFAVRLARIDPEHPKAADNRFIRH